MRYLRLLLAFAILPLTFCGCGFYSAPVMPPAGYAFSQIEAPIDTNAEATPVMTKMGESSSAAVLAMVAWGDASIQTAALNGGLTRVHHVDYMYKNIFFGCFQRFTIRVYGE